MGRIFTLIVCIALIAGAEAQTAKKKVVWQTPAYQGITIGKSKRSDLVRLLGKPQRTFHPEDEYDNSVLSMMAYDYDNLAGFKGRTVFTFKKRDGIVLDMMLYPALKSPLDYNWMISQYGTNYIKRLNDPCPSGKEPEGNLDTSNQSGAGFYLYPSKGFYVLVDYENQVKEIVYLKTCP
jgi:hypothetical protein